MDEDRTQDRTTRVPVAPAPEVRRPEPAPVPAPGRTPTGPHVTTLVWGLVLLVVAALVALPELGVDVDLGLVLPVALLVLGGLLLAGAAGATAAERRRGRQGG